MFNRALVAGIGLILALTVLVSFAMARITDEDKSDYHALLSKVNPTTDAPLLLTQDRTQVVKEIRSGNHHLKVRCASSSLSISKEGTYEEMENLEGELDALYTFQAKGGRYDYRTHQFTAHDGCLQGEGIEASAGQMELYLSHWPQEIPRPLLNHIDPDAELIALTGGAELQGSGGTITSDTIWIAQKGGELDCAQALGNTTLTSSNGERLTCAGNLLLDTKTQTLLASGDRVHYLEERGTFSADEMRLTYETDGDKTLPTEIHLTGHVHLRALKDDLPLRCALADEATYVPQTDTLTLKSLGDHRVLFLDESSDTRMSAKEIIAHTKEKKAEGIGGVRCFFQEEELNRLKGAIR